MMPALGGLGPGINAWVGALTGVDRQDAEEEHTAVLTSPRLRAGIAHSTGSIDAPSPQKSPLR